MNTLMTDTLFEELEILPKIDEAVIYTASGKPLTERQYRERIAEGISQCKIGKSTSLEQLSIKLGYNYAAL